MVRGEAVMILKELKITKPFGRLGLCPEPRWGA